ncbi:hypothetical protein BvCmsKKNP011_01131 [Escherichia coli]|nr:hypothetical protein BvCmsKKNP011_01131 [Escherichia coli]
MALLITKKCINCDMCEIKQKHIYFHSDTAMCY